ncbi:MAG: MarR family transcriptional regulator [Oscillospiraceae bacterium]|nr:MarR family transcriptional regulator [Oscillospiraceae bacterium]
MRKECKAHCPSEPVTPEERLNRRLHQCGHYLYHHATGPRQTTVIHLLQENGPMSQRDIQEAMDIQAGSVSELISKLESKGFLLRQRDEADKRKVTISLTPQGLALEAVHPEQVLARRYSVLSREEQAQLTLLLEKLLESWDTGGYGQ